jgi:hypothetical protein
VVCWASTQPTTRVLKCHLLYINQAAWAKEVSFWGSHRYISPPRRSYHSPKHFILGTAMGISSLKVYLHIAARNKPIITLHGSKCASRHATQCAVRKKEGWGHFGMKFTKVCFKWKVTAKFKAQLKTSHNFSMVKDRQNFPTNHL